MEAAGVQAGGVTQSLFSFRIVFLWFVCCGEVVHLLHSFPLFQLPSSAPSLVYVYIPPPSVSPSLPH